LNTAPNQTTGVSPFFAVYGYNALKTDGLLDTLTNTTPVYQQPATTQQKLREDIAEKQATWKLTDQIPRYFAIYVFINNIVSEILRYFYRSSISLAQEV